MCQAKTEILWVWKFFTSSMIHMRQNKHFLITASATLQLISMQWKTRQLGVTVSLSRLLSPDTCPACIHWKGSGTLQRVWVWNGSLPLIRSCLTCKAGLGASELVFERRPSLGGEHQNSYHATLCRAAAPRHPQPWISDKECFKPRGGVRIRFVGLHFLSLNALYSGQVALACRVVPACFSGTELSLYTCDLSPCSLASSTPDKPLPLCVLQNDSLPYIAGQPGWVLVCLLTQNVSGLTGNTSSHVVSH